MPELIRLKQRPFTAIRKAGGKPLVHGGSTEPPTPSIPTITRVWITPDGTQTIGTILTCNVTTTGYPPPSRSFDWKVNAISAGAPDSSSFDTSALSDGDLVTCDVTVTNSEGSAGPTTSENTVTMQEVVVLDPPVNTVAPTISPSGAQDIGTLFTADEGTWTGAPTIVYTYQWKADAVAIGGETAKTFDSTGRSDGEVITCDVTGTNNDGNSTAGSSNSATLQEVVAPGDRATTLLQSETDGLAIAFVDDSMLVKTAGAGDSTDILTGGVVPQSTTPGKIIRGANGLLGYQKHNYISTKLDGQAWLTVSSTITPTTGQEGGQSAWNIAHTSGGQSNNRNVTVSRFFIECDVQDQPSGTFDFGSPISGATRATYNFATNAFENVGGSILQASDTDLGNGWRRISLDCDRAEVDLALGFSGDYTGLQNGSIVVENVHVNIYPCVDFSYLDNPYDNISAPYDKWGLPIDHDLSNNSLGVLNEPQATNEWLDSLDPQQASWIAGGGSKSLVAGSPFAGLTQCTRYVATSTSNVHLSQSISHDGTNRVRLTGIVRNGNTGWIVLRPITSGSNGVWFDLVNGVVGNQAGATGEIYDLGNGWYKCVASAVSTSVPQSGRIQLAPSNGGFNPAVDDYYDIAYASGEGSLTDTSNPDMSPIITAGSQVTRELDWYEVNWTTIGSPSWHPLWSNQSYYVELENLQPGVNDRVPLGTQDWGAIVEARLGPHYRGPGSSWYIQNHTAGMHKLAASYPTTGQAVDVPISGMLVSWDGGNGTATNSGSFADSWKFKSATFRIGGRSSDVNVFHGHIKEMLIVPRTMNQTELNTLTTP